MPLFTTDTVTVAALPARNAAGATVAETEIARSASEGAEWQAAAMTASTSNDENFTPTSSWIRRDDAEVNHPERLCKSRQEEPAACGSAR
ncbi:MAG: hypothetical protein ACYC3L_12970 [Gemmatimonadaceae bacterium]